MTELGYLFLFLSNFLTLIITILNVKQAFKNKKDSNSDTDQGNELESRTKKD